MTSANSESEYDPASFSSSHVCCLSSTSQRRDIQLEVHAMSCRLSMLFHQHAQLLPLGQPGSHGPQPMAHHPWHLQVVPQANQLQCSGHILKTCHHCHHPELQLKAVATHRIAQAHWTAQEYPNHNQACKIQGLQQAVHICVLRSQLPRPCLEKQFPRQSQLATHLWPHSTPELPKFHLLCKQVLFEAT